MIGIFIVYMLIIVAFYFMFTAKNVSHEIDVLASDITKINQSMVYDLTDLLKEDSAVLSTYEAVDVGLYIESAAQDHHLDIAMYDISGRQIAKANYRQDSSIGYMTKEFLIIDGQVAYFLEVEHSFYMNNVRKNGAFVSLRNFAIVMIIITVYLLMLFFRRIVIKPIKKIHKEVNKVSHRYTNVQLDYHKDNEIGDLCRNFEDMGNRLEEAYQQQNDMIGALSHDMKTPLTSLFGYVELLKTKQDLPQEKRARYLDIIEQKSKDMQGMVDELKTYQKHESESLDQGKETVYLKSFLMSICQEYRLELESDKHQVVYDIDLKDSLEMALSPEKIRRLFGNLFHNSVKYAGTDFDMFVKAYQNKDKIIVQVEDNGVGLSSGEYDQVFKKFWRDDDSRNRETGGMGLGLSICEDIVTSMGGSIKAYQPTGGGFGIEFTLIP